MKTKDLIGGRAGTRTPDLLRVKQALYPAELRAQIYGFFHSKPLPHFTAVSGVLNRGSSRLDRVQSPFPVRFL